MYHAHFGLERGLFGEAIATDTAVFRAAKHDRLVAHFKLALASPSSAIVLHGTAGVGKTTLTSTALRAIGTRLALAWVGGMATNSAELLEMILVELGISTLRTTRIERLQLWRQFQGEMRATDSRLIIVVERTEDLSPEVLHALDQLTAPDAAGNPAANLVLLGNAGIHGHLAAPALDSLRQRIRLRVELEPFTEAELQEYLRHQVTAAGGSFDRVFAPGAVTALHRYSQGVARLVNTLCESALDIAAVQQQKQLTPELVAKTAVTLLGLAEPVPPAQPAAAAPPRAPAPAPAVEAAAPRPAPVMGPIFERRAAPRVAAAPASPPPAEVRAAPPPSSPAVSTPKVAAPPPEPPLEIDFDGGITDVADVALADFPVLTDAIEPAEAEPVAPTPTKATAPAPQPAPKVAPPVTAAPAAPSPPKPAPAPAAPPPPKAAPPAAAAPAAAKPAAKPAPRVEAPAAAPRPPAKPTPPAPTTTPLPHVAAAAKSAAAATAPPKDAQKPDAARGIAEAKSIADLSDIDAETLFADAELDLVSAALASAADWPDDDELSAPKTAAPRSATAAPAVSRPATAKQAAPAAKPAAAAKSAPPAEEPFDLFGLDDNAPLELIDDSTLPPANPRPKTAAR